MNDRAPTHIGPDPDDDREQIKEQLVDSLERISDEGVDRSELRRRVDLHYDELIEQAEIIDHVPVLTVGKIRSELHRNDRTADLTAGETWNAEER